MTENFEDLPERINNLRYEPTTPPTREPEETNLFLTQPAEFLVEVMARKLGESPHWSRLFGEYIDTYKRMDYSERALPAMRIYCEKWRRDFESWYVNGDIKIDIIWPPSIRRIENQQLPQTISGAMLQQLSITKFFVAVGQEVPGLNELGKTVSSDMSMGFLIPGSEEIIPLTQLTVNFRINLQEWDDYLNEDSRTTEDPFERTLANLDRLITTIKGLNDEEEVQVELGVTNDFKKKNV